MVQRQFCVIPRSWASIQMGAERHGYLDIYFEGGASRIWCQCACIVRVTGGGPRGVWCGHMSLWRLGSEPMLFGVGERMNSALDFGQTRSACHDVEWVGRCAYTVGRGAAQETGQA